MRLMQLIYASRPFGFDDACLNGILAASRRCNTRDGITGALICRADLFLQMLEGPRDAVTATFARIVRDDRHVEVMLVSCADIPARLFPAWAMRDDPARSWMWSQAQIQAGVLGAAGMDDVRAVFERLALEAR